MNLVLELELILSQPCASYISNILRDLFLTCFARKGNGEGCVVHANLSVMSERNKNGNCDLEV